MKRHNGDHRYTDDIAREYELITLAYPEFETLQRRMAEGIDFRTRGAVDAELPGEGRFRLLEIGTGNGFATEKLMFAGNPWSGEDTIITIDIDGEMIRKAREFLQHKEGTRHVQFREIDALAYLQDEPTESFDAVATSFTLHNFEVTYRQEVEREIHRVLKTGGLYTNADKYAPSGQAQFDLLAHHVDQFFDAFAPRERIELLRKWVIHNISDQSPRHAMFAEETVSRLEHQGFRNVSIDFHAGMQAVLRAYKG